MMTTKMEEKVLMGTPNAENVLMIFANVESKSHLKVINREVDMALLTVTKYLD